MTYTAHIFICAHMYICICAGVCVYTPYISASAPLVEYLIPINMHWCSVVQRRPPEVSELHYEELIEIQMSQKGTLCAIGGQSRCVWRWSGRR